MKVIRSIPKSVFSSCAGLMISCAPEAAKLVGLEAGCMLNNLVVDFYNSCFDYTHPSYYKEDVDFYESEDRIYFELDAKSLKYNLEGIFDDKKVRLLLEKLEMEELIKIILIDDGEFYTIMYDNYSYKDVLKERLENLKKNEENSIKRKEDKVRRKLCPK